MDQRSPPPQDTEQQYKLLLEAHRELKRLARAQHLLSSCNETQSRATSEPTLLQAICRLMVDEGGYGLAWVGFAQNDPDKTIRVMAQAGEGGEFLGSLQLSWSDQHARGLGPAGTAVRQGRSVIMHNLHTAGHLGDWVQTIAHRGFSGLIALPLRTKGHCFGVLQLYAPEVLHISPEEAKLLQQLADDLAFGIQSLRAREEQQQLQASIIKIATAVSAATGEDFFEQLARNMCDALGAHTGCLARFVPPATPGDLPKAQALAMASKTRLIDQRQEYSLEGTPSGQLLQQAQLVVPHGLLELYPQAPIIQASQTQAYAGRQLVNAAGQPIGIIFALFHQPLEQVDFVTTALQIIATRAAAEIERQSTDLRLQQLAFYDTLTGLPNRVLLQERMEHALANAQRRGRSGALLYIDLDNFKTLNDTLGHDKGDLLLQAVAQRLGQCMRATDTVARLGGDEFVVMLEDLDTDPQALAMEARHAAEKIIGELSQPYALAGYHYRSTPSIGIAPFHGTQSNVLDLLKQADLAMYQAKAAGRNTLRFFDPEMQSVVNARAALEDDLRHALATEQFCLHYQPQVDRHGKFMGVEALVRWNHPQRGMVAPSEFIAVAEDTGLIFALGRWVLHTACKQLGHWKDTPRTAHLTMAVNVSPQQFHHEQFAVEVARAIDVNEAPARRLKLELTENILVQNVDQTIATMDSLRSLGVRFSLDDFGTGYSSLNYLKRMPLDQIKIDQSFVRDLFSDQNDEAIIHTIIALGQSLGLEVIAEGVETTDQHMLLAQAGCPAFQGYLFSKPVALDVLERLLLQ